MGVPPSMKQAGSLNLPTDVLRRNALPSMIGMSRWLSRYVNTRAFPAAVTADKTKSRAQIAQEWLAFFVDGGYWDPGTGTIKGNIPVGTALPSNEVIIPSAIDGIDVTVVDQLEDTNLPGLFESLPIVSVSMPSTVTTIGHNCFRYCSSLATLSGFSTLLCDLPGVHVFNGGDSFW